MKALECVLVADGSSDRALVPILRWLMEQHVPNHVIQVEMADFRFVRQRPVSLTDRILEATRLYDPDCLFVHRDAENQDPQMRYREIDVAVGDAWRDSFRVPHICVVPVRMQEAWLLLDEKAIRRASGNPNGTIRLHLPDARRVESLPDPKAELHALLKEASGHSGRRLKKFRVEESALLVGEYMDNCGQLRGLPAFRRLEEDVVGMTTRLCPG